MPLPLGRCPECGFDAATVSPSDAAVAARSYPRRYRAVLVRPDEEDAEIVRRRPGPGEPSAVEHAFSAASRLRAAADALSRVRAHDDAEVDLDGPRPGGAAPAPTSEAVLGLVTSAAEALAAAIDAARGDEWRRSGRLVDGDGREVSALDVARQGVHAGVHHLRAAERAVAAARTRTW